MLLKRVIPVLALACATMSGSAHADEISEFQGRYAQLKAAMDTREPKRIKPLLTPDFTATDISGRTQNADAMIDRLAMIPVDPDWAEKTTVVSVDVQADSARVLQRMEASGSREGRDGKQHTMSFNTLSADTWVQGPSGWLLKATETQEMTFARDGQIVRQMKKGDPMPERGARGPGGPGREGMRRRPGGSPPMDLPPPADD